MHDVSGNPILSLVLPVRDTELYIRTALASLQRNADPAFEFIVVDDGSVDATTQLVDDARSVLPALRVLRHDRAVGLAQARNAGVAAARGTYVTFLDGDDWLAPGYLRELVDAIDGLGCDFVRVDHVQVEGTKRTLHRAPEARRDRVLDPRAAILPTYAQTMIDYPYAWAGVYRRDLGELLHFPGGLHTAEDRPWIWRLHREASTYGVVSLAGVFYRRLVSTSLTQVGDARQLQFLDAYRLVFAQLDDEPELRPKAIRQFLAVLAHHLSLAQRLPPAHRRRMRRAARDALAQLPREELLRTLPTDARRALLVPLLPNGPRSTRVAS
jgi:glycosyltransferase involved in cell wall biosynthesis